MSQGATWAERYTDAGGMASVARAERYATRAERNIETPGRNAIPMPGHGFDGPGRNAMPLALIAAGSAAAGPWYSPR